MPYRLFGYVLLTVVTSFYFFPFSPTFLPAANTKMILAALGLVILIAENARKKTAVIGKDFVLLSFWAIIVSLISLISVVINNTPDYTYVSYIVSMWVWMGGAYATIFVIKSFHGRVNVRILCHYLISVCVFQCLIAFFMDQFPAMKTIVDSLVEGEGFMGKVETRLYGIGASLDVAGMRFSAILIIIAFLVTHPEVPLSKREIVLFITCFMVISIIGNMMSRTTTLGMVSAIMYLIVYSCSNAFSNRRIGTLSTFWKYLALILTVFVTLSVYLYNNNQSVHYNLRFGFEGFFSLVETGHWETNSNDILKSMVVFPDNTKTWIIGDGYIRNPKIDPHYTGEITGGFYKNTDIGYLRFIFYFGIVGLFSFAFFLFSVARACSSRFKHYAKLFFMILILNYLVWFKVSTDLFVLFALFLSLPNDGDQAIEEVPEKV